MATAGSHDRIDWTKLHPIMKFGAGQRIQSLFGISVICYALISDSWHTVIADVSMVLNLSVKICDIDAFNLLILMTELSII